MGVDGIDPNRGASAHHEGEARINQLMAEQAVEVMVSRFEQRQIRVVIA